MAAAAGIEVRLNGVRQLCISILDEGRVGAMSKKVLTVGEILVEIVATTKGDGFREPQPLVGPFPSGAPAIFIDQIGRLGTPAAIISRVGDDDFGRLNMDRLIADGVDVSGIEVA